MRARRSTTSQCQPPLSARRSASPNECRQKFGLPDPRPDDRGSLVMSSQKELAGQVALITGSARNLGRAYAAALARNGADIVVHHHAPSSNSDAEDTARLVRAEGTRAVAVAGDITDISAVRKLFDETIKTFGRVDIV